MHTIKNLIKKAEVLINVLISLRSRSLDLDLDLDPNLDLALYRDLALQLEGDLKTVRTFESIPDLVMRKHYLDLNSMKEKALEQAQELEQVLMRSRDLVRPLNLDSDLNLACDLVQELARDLARYLADPDYLELTIEVPEDTPPERVREIVRQAALKADAAHRAHKGKGLQIDTVDIFGERFVPEGAGR